MWYKSENANLVKPSSIDSESSSKYVYLRKDISQVDPIGDIPAHYEWLEQKIPKEDWELYKTLMKHDGALDDVYAALTELAEMIVG